MKKTFKNLLSLTLVLLLTLSVALPASAASAPSKVTGLQSYNVDDDEINLRWKKVNGAYVYQVYVYSAGEWKYLGGTKKLRFEADNLVSSKEYKFKVRAYKYSGAKKVYGPFSNVINAATEPDEVDNVKVVSKTKTTVKLSWSQEKRATGYQVYVYSSSKGKYVKKASVKTNSVTVKELKSGTNYKFKVRAYFKTEHGVYCGEFSDAVKVKTNSSSASASSSGSSSGSSYIGSSKAASIALNHAGLKKSQVRDFSCELDKERNTVVYEVDFEYGKYEYSYEISAKSGKILHREKERG